MAQQIQRFSKSRPHLLGLPLDLAKRARSLSGTRPRSLKPQVPSRILRSIPNQETPMSCVSSRDTSTCEIHSVHHSMFPPLTSKSSFNTRAERMRLQGNLLPRKLYRAAYEGSGTLSQFVTPDCLPKHRDVPQLKLHEENAFQNVGDFDLIHDMNRYRMERQFVTPKKKDPSPFVSTTSDYGKSFANTNSRSADTSQALLRRKPIHSTTRVVSLATVCT